MEYIPSGSLATHIDELGFCTCLDAAFTILWDLAGALHYIHSVGVVHNDIKPSNILYSKTRGAVLIDFGIASDAAVLNHNAGTPWYLPPEYLSRRMRGPPGDIFALGVSMLWVLRKYKLPDKHAAEWRIVDLDHSVFERRERAEGAMRKWLEALKYLRIGLSDSEQGVEQIVRRMLLPPSAISVSSGTRYTAIDITEQLKLL